MHMIINGDLLNEIISCAQKSPLLRSKIDLNEGVKCTSQRLIDVLLPGSIHPVHRHRHTSETNILLRGKIFVVFYNEIGAQTQRFLLDATTGNYGVHIPIGQWHTIEVIEPSAIFEVRDTPYTPPTSEDTMD